MNVNRIAIQLEGKYDISKLARLGFHKINAGWMFDGKIHRYIFTPHNGLLLLTIGPRPSDWRTDASHGTDHRITFRNFQDWIMKCVDTIGTEGG